MARMAKPDVDYINGLCPAIAIEQKVITRTPRSTVGSMTEVYDYLRLLFARAGKTISPVSGREVKRDDVKDVTDHISKMETGTKILLLVAFRQHHNREVQEELSILMQKGFSRLVVNDTIERIEDLQQNTNAEDHLQKNMAYVLIDRFVVKNPMAIGFDEDDLHRMSDSVNTAFYEGEGEVILKVPDGESIQFSNRFELDGIKFEEPVPNLFSFNNPYGACPSCEGFSLVLGIDPDLVIPDKRLSVYSGE